MRHGLPSAPKPLRPISSERSFHLLFGAAGDLRIAQLDQFLGITLPSQNRVQNAQPCFPMQIADGVMQMNVHSIQCLLHVLHLLATGFGHIIPMPH